MMNDPFVVQQSEKWGESIAVMEKSPHEKINYMYLKALGREPCESEMESVLSFFESETAAGTEPKAAWANVGHVVVNMKEFIFIH